MSTSGKIILFGVIVIIVGGGAYLYIKKKKRDGTAKPQAGGDIGATDGDLPGAGTAAPGGSGTQPTSSGPIAPSAPVPGVGSSTPASPAGGSPQGSFGDTVSVAAVPAYPFPVPGDITFAETQAIRDFCALNTGSLLFKSTLTTKWGVARRLSERTGGNPLTIYNELKKYKGC